MQHAPAAQSFIAAVITISKRQFASLELFKEVECLKKDRVTKLPFTGKVEKREIFKHIGIGGSYEATVNSHLAKAGETADFEAQSLPWGQWLPGSTTVIEHKDQLYVRFYLHNNTTVETTWYLDGVKVDKTAIPDVLPKDSYQPSARQAEAGLTDFADQSKPFTAALRNIVECTVNGQKHLPFA